MPKKTEFAALLDEFGLSTSKAAAMLGNQPQTVRRWRCGLTQAPPWAFELIKIKMERKQ